MNKSYQVEYLPKAYRQAIERFMHSLYGEQVPLQSHECEVAFKYAMAGLPSKKAAADIVAERAEYQS